MNKLIRVRLVTGKLLRRFTALVLLVLVGRTFNANGQTVTSVYSLGNSPDGSEPFAGLVQGSDGNYYGTTTQGGNTNVNNLGNGTVFRISPAGCFTILYSFVGYPTDGANPYGGLVQGGDGHFYGTTFYGGSQGGGTVFRISPSGTYTSLYSSTSGPYSSLVQGSDGNLYGTTKYGTVFRISLSGTYKLLHTFVHQSDGADLEASLVQGSDGNFYGTTSQGGPGYCRGNGCGILFRISPSGTYTSLYSFGVSPNDGTDPLGALVQGSDGNFYGTTSQGGAGYCSANGCGTVFRISPSGTYTSLYSFGVSPDDGATPFGGLVQGSDGNFYGTTSAGGINGSGTVFQISSSGNYTNLYSFGSSPGDGSFPYAGLVQGSDGSFYGVTNLGGTNGFNYLLGRYGYGTVFKLTVPLNPPANQISGMQFSGADIVLNIPSVAYETYQLQFTTDPASGIWSNVPGVSVTNSIGALLTLTNSGGAVGPQGFYRFDITP